MHQKLPIKINKVIVIKTAQIGHKSKSGLKIYSQYTQYTFNCNKSLSYRYLELLIVSISRRTVRWAVLSLFIISQQTLWRWDYGGPLVYYISFAKHLNVKEFVHMKTYIGSLIWNNANNVSSSKFLATTKCHS